LKTDRPRWRFTLAHEIGHLILHSKLLKDKISEKSDTEATLSFKSFAAEMTSKRLEYQANLFAGTLLLPISTFGSLVQEYFLEERIHKEHLYWDNQPINQQLALTLLARISTTYEVSIEVAKIRLIALGLLIDDRYKSIRDILKEMKLM
jgi:Zn-dependent peptidase ImmA (M78 family)